MKIYKVKCTHKSCKMYTEIKTAQKPLNYMDSGRLYLEKIKCPKCGNMSNFRVMEDL